MTEVGKDRECWSWLQ